MENTKKDFEGFYEILCNTLKKEKGSMYEDITQYGPDFFQLLCKILDDNRTDWHTKLVISAALAYFVVPKDIIPEEKYGAMGYVDDILICAYVLNEIKSKVSEDLLIDNWEKKGDILEIVDNTLSKSKKVIGNKYIKILQLVGLRREKDFRFPTIDVKRKQRETGESVDRLINEKTELIGLLAFVTRVLYRERPNRNINALREYLSSQDTYGEIKKILSLLEEKTN